MSLNFTSLGPSELGPARRARGIQAGDHIVQIYDGEPMLANVVSTFLFTGMRTGEAAIMIADRPHREAFERMLDAAGVDIRQALDEGRYASLDAGEALAGFMIDGDPGPARFGETIGGLIARAAAKGRNVRIYGEMVALLWAQGNVAGAVALEEMWNDLAEDYEFRLLCAYPTHAFSDGDLPALGEICGRHSHVIPPGE